MTRSTAREVSVESSETQDTSQAQPESGYFYLLCHGAVSHGKATLGSTSVGVYQQYNQVLEFQEIWLIVKEYLPPTYVLPAGECPEFDLSPLDADEIRMWLNNAPH